MGRSSCKVDRHLLRNRREELRLTQAEVANGVGIHLTRYQKIEWEGVTSPKTAQKLADLFGFSSIDTLQQGIELPDSRDYVQQIEQKIREELEKDGSALLQQALQKFIAETSFTSGSADENREAAIGYFAEDIAQRIEAVQLVRNKDEIATLSELTGLSEEGLLRPANADGTWFVNIHHREHQSEGFNARSEVTHRAYWAIGTIKKYVAELKEHQWCSDGSIRLIQDGFWYRIEISNPYLRRTIRIDLVRCLPDAKGLRWVKPFWRDEYLIREPLIRWAREHFNFVTDFEGKQSPSGDIRHLRLLITEYDRGIVHPTGIMVISGNLEEMTDTTVESFRREGKTHTLVLDWLTNDLKYSLAPLLADYPRECWSLSGLVISLDETKARKRPLVECYFGPKFSIELCEQVGEDKFEPVPWRENDRKVLQEKIQKMLDTPTDWSTDEPRRVFAPYTAEP